MAVSRDSVAILHMFWERDCYQAINNLIKQTMISTQVCLSSQLQMPDCRNYQESSEQPFAGPFQSLQLQKLMKLSETYQKDQQNQCHEMIGSDFIKCWVGCCNFYFFIFTIKIAESAG